MKEKIKRLGHYGIKAGSHIKKHSVKAGVHVKKHGLRFVRNTKIQAFFLITFAIIILDQMSKWFAELNYEYRSVDIIQNILSVNFVRNSGGGFGILKDQLWFFIGFSIFVLIFIMYYREKIESRFHVPLAFVTGGIMGNLIDRFVFGYVRDFIDFHFWPVFNIADLFIAVGTFWIIVLCWKLDKD